MLVLTRKIGEVLCIGNDIEITLVDLNAYQAKIGINAPKNIAVDRSEIRARKLLEGANNAVPDQERR